MKIFNQVKSVPEEYKKNFQRKDRTLTSVKPIWRIQKLTEIFGPCGMGWYVNITSCKTNELRNGAISIVMEVDLVYRIPETKVWSKPVHGIGTGWAVYKNSKGEWMQDDEAWKKAYTDAISVACKSLGFAADIYMDSEDDKYGQEANNTIIAVPIAKPTQEEVKQPHTVESKQTVSKQEPTKEEAPKEKRELTPESQKWNEFVTWMAKKPPMISDMVLKDEIEKKWKISNINFQKLLRESGRD